MRALVAGLGALLVVVTTNCSDQTVLDQGNLVIRCPDSRGAIPVNDGQVTIDGLNMRVAADLRGPTAPEDGMTFAIEVQHALSSPTSPSASIQCVRVRLTDENAQWDAVPRRIDEVRDGSRARILSKGRDGPHWRPNDLVDVTVWLKTERGRHVLALGRQPIHAAP